MNNNITNKHPEAGHGTLKSYVTGFILSLVLTIVPYFLVVNHILTGNALLAAILALAMVQLIVQLLFFLHMGQEPKPHMNFIVFLSFISIIFIIILASLWIMAHLNYNMLPMKVDNLMKNGEGF